MPQLEHHVFIASSSESQWLARKISGALKSIKLPKVDGYDVSVRIDAWYHFGSWPPGQSTLETLELRIAECDFGVAVMSEDDWTISHDAPAKPAPRDNVVFELGYLMGRMGRRRGFFFFPSNQDFKMPSDLLGITGLPYTIKDRNNVLPDVSDLCDQIVDHMNKLARDEREQARKVRTPLSSSVKFEWNVASVPKRLGMLSKRSTATLHLTVRSADSDVDEVRLYFSPPLDLYKSGWRVEEDDYGIYLWKKVARGKITQPGCRMVFDVTSRRAGEQQIRIVGCVDGQRKYEKVLILPISSQ